MKTSGAPGGSLAIVTGADTGYFEYLRGAVASIRSFPKAADVHLTVLDFGLEAEQRAWLADAGAHLLVPDFPADVPDALRVPRNLGYVTRLYMPDYVPGFDRYLWFDADAWLQQWDAIDHLVDGSRREGLSVAHEGHPSYPFEGWLFRWTAKHYVLGNGPVTGLRLALRRDQLNAGIVCMERDAPQWQQWRQELWRAAAKTGAMSPHDQFSLNRLVHSGRMEAAILDPTDNWICSRGVPMVDSATQAFCTPTPDHTPISIMHMAGAKAKQDVFELATTAGGTVRTRFRYEDRPAVSA